MRRTRFQQGRVIAIDGVVAAGLADCIDDLLVAEVYPKLPSAENPRAAKAAAAAGIIADLIDSHAEHPGEPLRLCKFSSGDPRFLRDCRDCAAQAPRLTIRADTPVIAGSAAKYGDQALYLKYPLVGVPDRSAFACDWPYAARRYNGSGPLSYNCRSRILRNLVN